MVYRMFPTPRDELHALVAQAKTQGQSHIAALLPAGAYGDLMESTLRAEAQVVGAQVATVSRYAAETNSFVEVAQALAKQPFDALLLADAPQRVALIAPALAASGLWSSPSAERPPAGARPITLLAPAVAFDPAVLRSSARYLQGALFSVPFDAQLAQGPAQRFVERFQAQFGESPDTFAALAHDAYKLVRAAVDGGSRTRKQLGENLWRAESPELAGPSPGLSPSREARRPTRLLQLQGDVFGELGARQPAAAAR
jgi:ABC-type branched-subunit amino acid transport system substrate-binding protein